MKDKMEANIYDDNHLFTACAYCQISNEINEQKSSFEQQRKYFEKLLNNHKNWDLKTIFVDEESGMSLKSRDQFYKMIDACKKGEFDLIITKNVFRFAKNFQDCVSVVRELRNLPHPVGVYFEADGIFTLSKEFELIHSMMATLAQEESAKKRDPIDYSLKNRLKKSNKYFN